jgi:prepilin-type N-terminal cleavage/methylation domain-containing protein
LHRPRGFTLLELLAVFSVLGVLLALALPALQQVREAARKAQCQDHLHQVGIALHGYEQSARLFPQLMYPTEGGSHWDWRGFSPHAMLLPYLDMKPLHQRLDFKRWALDFGSNHDAGRTVVDVFRCPTDLDPDDGDPGVNYALCLGANVGFSSDGYILKPSDQNGIIAGTTRVSMASITDGTSNVIAASEQIVGGAADPQGRFANYRYAPGSIPVGMTLAFPSAADLVTWSTACEGAFIDSPRIARQWHRGLPGQTSFNTLLPPNAKSSNCSIHCFNNCDSDGAGLYTARSRHPGGVQALMADNSIGFVSESIDLTLWQRMGARDDGNPTAGWR